MNKAFLLPGEFGFYKEATQVSTILGSCVSVTLFEPNRKMGGLNHFLLPEEGGALNGGKVADYAIKALVKEALLAGCLPSNLIAGVYGGGHVITSFNRNDSIGERNIMAAKQILTSLKIPVKHADVRGDTSRRIILNTETGEVNVFNTIPSQAQISDRAKAIRKAEKKPGVLVVDDSSMVRNIVTRAIEKDGRLQVVGHAADPYEAREKIIECEPDVICLDIMMPKMNGLEFLKRIMYFKPIPTIVLSTMVREGNALWMDLKRAGALGMVNKDDMKIYKDTDNLQQTLIPKLLFAAGVKVMKRDPNK